MRGAVLAVALLSAGGAQAQSALPDTENGRYALAPIADGVLRLDTRNGAVSTCKNDGSGWACYATPDERSAFDAEIGRLQEENDRLRAQIAANSVGQDKSGDAAPKSDPLVPRIMPPSADGERKIEIPLPSDRDVNRFMSFVENAWRRLVEMTGRLQRDSDGKI